MAQETPTPLETHAFGATKTVEPEAVPVQPRAKLNRVLDPNDLSATQLRNASKRALKDGDDEVSDFFYALYEQRRDEDATGRHAALPNKQRTKLSNESYVSNVMRVYGPKEPSQAKAKARTEGRKTQTRRELDEALENLTPAERENLMRTMGSRPKRLFSPGPAVADKQETDAQAYRRRQRLAADEDRLYSRANGNMPWRKRFKVIVPALERLGYSTQDAQDIAIDAPINASYDNDRAVYEALTYGNRITPGNLGQQSAVIQALTDPAGVEQSAEAQAALRQFELQDAPVAERLARSRARTGQLLGTLANWLKPKADALGELPMPTGVGGLFLINLFFLAAIVPANNQGWTRIQLFYLTLLGGTHFTQVLPPKEKVVDSPYAVAALNIARAAGGAANALGATAAAAGAIVGGPVAVAHDIAQAAGALGQLPSWLSSTVDQGASQALQDYGKNLGKKAGGSGYAPAPSAGAYPPLPPPPVVTRV